MVDQTVFILGEDRDRIIRCIILLRDGFRISVDPVDDIQRHIIRGIIRCIFVDIRLLFLLPRDRSHIIIGR